METLNATVYEYGFLAERIVLEIFRDNGFVVKREIYPNNIGFDFWAEKNGIKYAIEVKAYRKLNGNRIPVRNTAIRFSNAFAHGGFDPNVVPVIVVVGCVEQDGDERPFFDELRIFNSNIKLIDISNLLYMVETNEPLRKKLISLLPFSIDGVDPVRPDLEVAPIVLKEAIDKWAAYICRIKGWVPSKEENAEYENVCSKILEELFADDLTRWKKQQPSNDGLYRFDAIAKIKHGNKKEFWEMLERYFNSKYIIFEYKNYSKEITQAQVYTTVKYLYAKALRSVAILLSTNGADKHADIAIRGILREEGKLIVALSNADLVTMLEMKQRDEDPADFLSERLDTLLIDLEK